MQQERLPFKQRIRDEIRSGDWGALGGLVALFTILNWFFLKPWTLSIDGYREPVIFVSTLSDLMRPTFRTAVIGLVGVFLAIQYRSLNLQWTTLQDGPRIRVVVGVSAFLLAWIYSTYDYNHFLQQSHSLDRALLAMLWIGVVWRPMFVFPFLLVLWPMIGQFNVPIGGLSWAIPFLPARIVLLFSATLLTGLATKKWQTSHFVFMLFCLVASHYVPSGIRKLQIGWLPHDQVYFLLPTTYANGWLGFLEAAQIDRLTNFMAWANWPAKLLTIVAECGAVFMLWRHRTVRLFLIVWICFHVGIFVTSGIFFWPWIVILVTLLILTWRNPLLSVGQLRPVHFMVSAILIASSAYWAKPAVLSWIDSPATYTYRITAVGQSGNEYSMSPGYMAPFEYQFTLGGFSYLDKQPGLRITWGATDLSTSQRLQAALSADDLLAIEQELGSLRYNEKRTQAMQELLVAYAKSLNSDAPKRVLPHWMCAPKRLWGFAKENAYDGRERIVSVRIDQVFSAFLNGHYQEIRSREVFDVAVGQNR